MREHRLIQSKKPTSVKTDFPPPTEELLEEFDEMPDWDDRWEYIIELGRELPELPDEHKISENIVTGCMSTVWLVTQRKSAEGAAQPDQIEILADSDSLIVKGLIVVLLSFYDAKTPSEVMLCDEKSFLSTLGLDQHLSPNRRNGLFSMVGRIKQLATELASQ